MTITECGSLLCKAEVEVRLAEVLRKEGNNGNDFDTGERGNKSVVDLG